MDEDRSKVGKQRKRKLALKTTTEKYFEEKYLLGDDLDEALPDDGYDRFINNISMTL